MSNHSAANFVYPLAQSMRTNGISPDVRRKIYRDVIAELQREDYHDYPELFALDDILQEVIFEFQGDRWKEYYTIDTSQIKRAKRKGYSDYFFEF